MLFYLNLDNFTLFPTNVSKFWKKHIVKNYREIKIVTNNFFISIFLKLNLWFWSVLISYLLIHVSKRNEIWFETNIIFIQTNHKLFQMISWNSLMGTAFFRSIIFNIWNFLKWVAVSSFFVILKNRFAVMDY